MLLLENSLSHFQKKIKNLVRYFENPKSNFKKFVLSRWLNSRKSKLNPYEVCLYISILVDNTHRVKLIICLPSLKSSFDKNLKPYKFIKKFCSRRESTYVSQNWRHVTMGITKQTKLCKTHVRNTQNLKFCFKEVDHFQELKTVVCVMVVDIFLFWLKTLIE